MGDFLVQVRLRARPPVRPGVARCLDRRGQGAAARPARPGDRRSWVRWTGGPLISHDLGCVAICPARDQPRKPRAQVPRPQGGPGHCGPHGGGSPRHAAASSIWLVRHRGHSNRLGRPALRHSLVHDRIFRGRPVGRGPPADDRGIAARLPGSRGGCLSPGASGRAGAIAGIGSISDMGSDSFRGVGRRAKDSRRQGAWSRCL